jgi:hypothetical protein
LVENFISASADDLLQQNLAQFIATGPATPTERRRRVRRATVALLQSPDYQLC